jgi:hypothetical protein
MSSEPHVDPRGRRLAPTPEEIETWAEREHKRRAAWLAGPSEEERQEWSRRYRWRGSLGLEESRLGPTREDLELWAEREHKRRQAWLEGPNAMERQDWARAQHRQAQVDLGESAPAPTPDEIEAFATRERQRRQQWLDGPLEEEKDQWARQQATGFLGELANLPDFLEAQLPANAELFLRELELAGKGALYAVSRAPQRLWSYFVRAGKAVDDEFYQPPRRRRVRY